MVRKSQSPFTFWKIGSNALATAARLGLSPSIIEDARGMLSQGTQELETLLTDLMREKEQAEALTRKFEREEQEVAKQNKEMEGRLQQMRR